MMHASIETVHLGTQPPVAQMCDSKSGLQELFHAHPAEGTVNTALEKKETGVDSSNACYSILIIVRNTLSLCLIEDASCEVRHNLIPESELCPKQAPDLAKRNLVAFINTINEARKKITTLH